MKKLIREARLAINDQFELLEEAAENVQQRTQIDWTMEDEEDPFADE